MISHLFLNDENHIELKRNLKRDILLPIAIRTLGLTSQLLDPDLLNFDVFSALFSPRRKKYKARKRLLKESLS